MVRVAPAVAVACGGAAGATLRWGLTRSLGGVEDGFPWMLLGVNTAGSLLLGLLVVLTAEGRRELWRLGLGPGFCGSLTTFSSFALLTAELGRDGNIAVAAAFVGLSVALAVAALVAGGAAAARRSAGSAAP